MKKYAFNVSDIAVSLIKLIFYGIVFFFNGFFFCLYVQDQLIKLFLQKFSFLKLNLNASRSLCFSDFSFQQHNIIVQRSLFIFTKFFSHLAMLQLSQLFAIILSASFKIASVFFQFFILYKEKYTFAFAFSIAL